MSQDIRTRNALFKAVTFSQLPGWPEDDLKTAWSAFQNSCGALAKRPAWSQICAKASLLSPTIAARRQFFEDEFEPFRIVNPDQTQDGTVTGYYEPRLRGSLSRKDAFTVPVYGRPRDLYVLDWKDIPEALRHGEIQVVRLANQKLAIAPGAGSDGNVLNVGLSPLDTRDRVLRLRLTGRTAVPNFTRGQIGDSLDAPVLAYVDDPYSLYAMQIQGSGRILLADGRELRLR